MIGYQLQEHKVTWWKYKTGLIGVNVLVPGEGGKRKNFNLHCLDEERERGFVSSVQHETRGSGCGVRADCWRECGSSSARIQLCTEDTCNRWATS